MDDSKRWQRVIGLVTHTYYTLHHDIAADDPEFVAGLEALLEDFAYQAQRSVAFPQTPEELQTLISDFVADATDQAGKVFVQLISLFCDFARYAEQTSPDIDVPGFLRQAGLRAALDE